MRKIKDNSIVLAIILLSLILILFLQKFGYKSYSRYVSDTLHYNQGIVVEDFLMKTLNMMKVLNYIWVHRI